MPQQRAITIGTFDGVHLGHRALIDAARGAVSDTGHVTALTFEPAPLAVLRPAHAPPRLITSQERRDLLLLAGADEVIELDPRSGLLDLSAEAFTQLLRDQFAPDAIIEGPDFRFGHRRAGDVAFLRRAFEPGGTRVIEVPAVEAALEDQSIVTVSSTMIRRFLTLGRTRDAARLLGGRFTITAEVVSGDRRGRTIGCPTANLATGDRLLPADGIYSGRGVLEDGRTYPAAISVGTKPTFAPAQRTCEAHLIGFDGPVDTYGWKLSLAFGDWLRAQFRYDSVTALVEQIARDCARTAERECVA